jgi:hypothetical protein
MKPRALSAQEQRSREWHQALAERPEAIGAAESAGDWQPEARS